MDWDTLRETSLQRNIQQLDDVMPSFSQTLHGSQKRFLNNVFGCFPVLDPGQGKTKQGVAIFIHPVIRVYFQGAFHAPSIS